MLNRISGALNRGFRYATDDVFQKIKFYKKAERPYMLDDNFVIGAVATTSMVLKDGAGCIMYTTQSLNNENIPKDKRGFVAAVDATNGVLMIAFQIAAFFGMAKLQAGLFNKWFGDYFNRASRKAAKCLVEKVSGKEFNGAEFNTLYTKHRQKALDAFNYISTMVATTFLAKRVLVPFVATPLADLTRKYILKDETVNDNINMKYDYLFMKNAAMHGRYEKMYNNFYS